MNSSLINGLAIGHQRFQFLVTDSSLAARCETCPWIVFTILTEGET